MTLFVLIDAVLGIEASFVCARSTLYQLSFILNLSWVSRGYMTLS